WMPLIVGWPNVGGPVPAARAAGPARAMITPIARTPSVTAAKRRMRMSPPFSKLVAAGCRPSRCGGSRTSRGAPVSTPIDDLGQVETLQARAPDRLDRLLQE